MAKIVKVINDLNPDEAIFWKIESNTFILFQEGKPLSNHTKASLFNTQFRKLLSLLNWSKEAWTNEVLDPLSP